MKVVIETCNVNNCITENNKSIFLDGTVKLSEEKFMITDLFGSEYKVSLNDYSDIALDDLHLKDVYGQGVMTNQALIFNEINSFLKRCLFEDKSIIIKRTYWSNEDFAELEFTSVVRP